MASPGTLGRFNTKSPSIKRIMQESRELSRCPDPTLTAAPLESNLFEWHFTLTGPPSSSYTDGIYHGRIVLPPSYPLRPPSFRFLTPSGRFETNREICLSISGHHEETWQPAWGIRTALCAIRAFMAGDAKGQVGGLDMHPQAREKLAKESRGWRCAACGGKSNEEIIAECAAQWQDNNPAQDPDKAAPDQAVPDELRLAFREDLDKNRRPSTSAAAAAAAEEGVTAEAGAKASMTSQQTTTLDVPPQKNDASIQSPSAISPLSPLPSPAPTRTSPAATTTATSPSSPTPPRARPPAAGAAGAAAAAVAPVVRAATATATAIDTSPPAWIDKAIIGVALALLVMLLKRMAGPVDY